MLLTKKKGISMSIKNVAFSAAILTLGLFGTQSTVYAIHKGAGDLVCGNCHTMHNSQGEGGLGGNSDGSLILLRGPVGTRAEIHKLCLQCHATNGAQAEVQHAPQSVKAPKVWSSAAWTSDDAFNKIGSGGNFSSELDTSWTKITTDKLGYGHSLGATNILPPGGDTAISEFSCTNCHDPHGTANTADTNINIFRNLRVNPTGAGDNSGVKFKVDPAGTYYQNKSYVGGVNGTYFGGSETDNGGNVVWPVYRGTLTGNPVTDSANSNSYGTGWDGDSAQTMSKWCAQCHDTWHEDLPQGSQNQAHVYGAGYYDLDLDTRRHAVNSMVPRASAQGCAGSCHVSLLDRSNYSTALITAGKGLPVTASQYYASNAYYLPECGVAGNPACSGMDTSYGGTSGNNNKVFCLTCHFAHGGAYYDNLRWDYTNSVGSGTQTANGVPSNKGCQLCHNRGG